MKKKFTILFFCLQFTICSLFSFSQTNIYHPFPDSNAVWRVNRDYPLAFPPYYTTARFQYSINGDTLINAKIYKKIIREGDCCSDILIPAGQNGYYSINLSNGYIGAIREDINFKKIFFVVKDSTNEYLFYDFNLNIGDTLFGLISTKIYYFTGENYDNIIVKSIDSLLINGNFRKRLGFEFTCTGDTLSIIEGIGCNSGLFEAFPQHIDCYNGALVCFKINDTILYPDTASSYSCELFNSINNNFHKTNFNIYPNPIYAKCDITIDNNYGNRLNLKIFNVLGKEEEFISFFLQNKIIVKSEGLQNGIHFFHFFDDNKLISTEKIIVMKSNQ